MKRALLLLLLLSAVPALGKNANELKAVCASNAPGDPLYCAGYIAGVYDNDISAVFTVTGHYQVKQFIEAFLDYMREHPEMGDVSAPWILPVAWESRKLITFIPPPKKETP